MADECSQKTPLPLRFTFPQASKLEALFSQAGPYLFHNPHLRAFVILIFSAALLIQPLVDMIYNF